MFDSVKNQPVSSQCHTAKFVQRGCPQGEVSKPAMPIIPHSNVPRYGTVHLSNLLLLQASSFRVRLDPYSLS